MKKQILVATLVFCLFLPFVFAFYDVDNYPGSEATSGIDLQDNHPSDDPLERSSLGQTFNATDSYYLTSAGFYLKKTGNPTGNGYVRLYNMSGNYGSTGVPTGAALVSSDAYDVSTIAGAKQLVNFTFSTAYQLATGTQYCLAYEEPAPGGTINGANYITAYVDNAAANHSGNAFSYINGAYTAHGTWDAGFYIEGVLSLTDSVDVNNNDPFNKDEYGWLNFTVYDFKGVADLDTVDLHINTTGDTNNFTLRWTQATNTFSEVSDPDSICTFDTVNSTRTNVNATHDLISYRFMLTAGQSGECDVNITITSDTLAQHSELYSSLFEYIYYNWNTQVYDLINSAFNFWGLTGTLSKIQTLVTTMTTYFADAMVNIASLIVQQFRIITEIFTPFIRWFIRFVTFFINLFTYLHQLFNGTLTGASDLWTIIGISGWYEFVPVLMFLAWWHSWEQRSKTRGEITVLLGDVNAVMNITAYFMTMFNQVINIVVDYTFRLFDAIV